MSQTDSNPKRKAEKSPKTTAEGSSHAKCVIKMPIMLYAGSSIDGSNDSLDVKQMWDNALLEKERKQAEKNSEANKNIPREQDHPVGPTETQVNNNTDGISTEKQGEQTHFKAITNENLQNININYVIAEQNVQIASASATGPNEIAAEGDN